MGACILKESPQTAVEVVRSDSLPAVPRVSRLSRLSGLASPRGSLRASPRAQRDHESGALTERQCLDETMLIDRSSLVVRRLGSITDAYKLDNGNIGQGAFGSVRRCTRKATDVEYAVKAVSKGDTVSLEIFRMEVASMKMLDHPNIINLFETFEDNRRVYLVMELCTGGELLSRIRQAGHLSELEGCIVMRQVLLAVRYMHDRSVAHRDLKPENCLLQNEGPIEGNVLKVIDFGSSSHAKPGSTMTAVVGTPSYLAPEVIEQSYDNKCDLWSCGATMFVVLCGCLPFPGKTRQQVLDKVQEAQISFKAPAWKVVSADAQNLLKWLLKADPQARCTAKQALGHVWVKDKSPKATPSMKLTASFIEELKTFRSQNRLKKAALHVITRQLDDAQTQNLRATFMALDKDGNGTLTLGELKEGLQKSGVSRAAEAAARVMESLDVDGSGCVDYTEFLAAALDRDSYLEETLCRTAFGVFDLNGDGLISRTELRKVLDGGSKDRLMDAKRESLLCELDKNGDGSIDFGEFMAMMSRTTGPPPKARLGSA